MFSSGAGIRRTRVWCPVFLPKFSHEKCVSGRFARILVLMLAVAPAAQATELPWPVEVLSRCSNASWIQGSPLPFELEVSLKQEAQWLNHDRDGPIARRTAVALLNQLEKLPCHPLAGYWAHRASVTVGLAQLRESGVESALPWLDVAAQAWAARPAEIVDFHLADALLRRAARRPVRDFLSRVQAAGQEPERIAGWIAEIDRGRLPRLSDDASGRDTLLAGLIALALGWPAAVTGWMVCRAREPVRHRGWLLAAGLPFAYLSSFGVSAVASLAYRRIIPSTVQPTNAEGALIAIAVLAGAPAGIAMLLAAWRRRSR